jgi:hypothetical protein
MDYPPDSPQHRAPSLYAKIFVRLEQLFSKYVLCSRFNNDIGKR